MSRPVSPHLTWYKPQITTVLSVFHRLSGTALTAGAVLVGAASVAALIQLRSLEDIPSMASVSRTHFSRQSHE